MISSVRRSEVDTADSSVATEPVISQLTDRGYTSNR